MSPAPYGLQPLPNKDEPKRFRPADYLDSHEMIEAYLVEAIETESDAVIAYAARHAAEAMENLRLKRKR